MKNKNIFFFFLTLIIIIYSIFITNLDIYKSKYNGNETTINGTIYDYNIDGNKLSINIKSKEKLICNYYFKNEQEKNYYVENLKLGYKLNLEGTLTKPNNNSVPNLFNYKNYLFNNKIYWIFNIEKIEIVSKKTNIFYNIKNWIITHINSYKYSKNYLYVFILGDNSKIDNNVLTSYQNNGISHLFAISGMHVGLLTSIIIFVLKKIKLKDNIISIITVLFLIFYMFLTGLSASVIRASLFFIILKFNKIFNLNISTFNILLLTISILLIINPFLIYNIGFEYSCVVVLNLIYFSDLINKRKTYINKIFITSFIAFLVGIPITIYNFFHINLISILINLIFVPFISLILFPLSILTFVFPILDIINYIFIIILENISLFINNIKVLDIILAKPNILIIIIYYIVIISSLIMMRKNKIKYFILLILLIFIHTNYSYIDSKFYMIMIDVGQGDSILIKLPNNKSNILIDTGGRINYSTEKWMIRNSDNTITNNTLVPLFKSLGIKKIDYLILSHGDNDHMGEAINLVNNFIVDKVILNCGEYNDLESELIKVLNKKKIKYYSCINELNIDKYKLNFLQTKEYDNENDNSNVIYTNMDGVKMMFMGDASVNTEKVIINSYNLPDIDILKVGHHGSDTSSSKEFINKISPNTSIISVGKNNRYGHPKQSVLDTLKDSKIYRTDLDGSIEIKINKDKYKIRTCSP